MPWAIGDTPQYLWIGLLTIQTMDASWLDAPDTPVVLRVGFGLDGVFADVEKALRTLALQVFQTPLPQLSRDQRRLLWRVVRASDNFWEQLDEIEDGMVARLAFLARSHGWEVIFLVRRIDTNGATVQAQSQHWLAAKGFPLATVWPIDRPMPQVTAALGLDAVVDSPFEHEIEEADDDALPAGEGREPGKPATPLGSIGECLERLCEMEHRPRSWWFDLRGRLPGLVPASRAH